MARKKKEVPTGKLAIRHKRNGFSTIITAQEFMAHDETFRSKWEVLNEFAEADPVEEEAEFELGDEPEKEDPVT